MTCLPRAETTFSAAMGVNEGRVLSAPGGCHTFPQMQGLRITHTPSLPAPAGRSLPRGTSTAGYGWFHKDSREEPTVLRLQLGSSSPFVIPSDP